MAALVVGCEKAELPVPEPVSGLKAYPGLYRAKVEFSVPSDAVVSKVFHSSGKYVETAIGDPSEVQTVIVEGLSSGENIIRVVTLNSEGKNSDPRGVKVQVYDDAYGARLLNRDLIEQSTLSSTSVELYFGDANDGEVEMRIEYVATDGSEKTLSVTPDQTIVRIEGIDLSKDYFYYAVYKPTADFIDEYCTPAINARTAAMKNFEKDVWRVGEGAGEEIVDNDASTVWTPQGGVGASIVVDMQVEKIYDGFSIVQAGDLVSSTFASRFRFESSNDNVNWEVVREAKLKLNGYRQTYAFPSSLSSRYFRITFTETYSADLPIAIAEIDLYNDLRTSGDSGETMPQIVNGKVPFATDGSDRFPAVGAGRFQQVAGWVHDGAYITADGDQFCLWCAPVWGCSAIDNGKVYQVLDLLPGVYGFKMDVGHSTDVNGVDVFAVVARGTTIPRMDALASPEVVAHGDVVEHVSSIYSVPFTVKEAGSFAVGLVYSLYDMYGVTGYVWSDMYMKGFELEAL